MREQTGKTKAAKSARRAVIAKAVLQQESTGTIAKKLGVSRMTICRELHDPETQALIRSWMQPHHASIQRMIPRALAAVNKGLKPSQEMRDRLNAVKTLGTVMGWAEGRPDDSSDSKQLRWSGSLEQLLAVYEQITVEP